MDERSLDVKIAERARNKADCNYAWRLKNRERERKKNRLYCETHREEKRAYDINYRGAHKLKRQLHDRVRQPQNKLHHRKHVLCTTVKGKTIYLHNVVKRPYPSDSHCELCGHEKGRLVYHHFDETTELMHLSIQAEQKVFVHGVWVCQPCNLFIHRLTEFPFLAEKLKALKTMLYSQHRGQAY